MDEVPRLVQEERRVVTATPDRRARAMPLPPYSFVPGHDHPHPVTDPAGHLHGRTPSTPMASEVLATIPGESAARREALAARLVTNPHWLYAIDLFNGGYYWEAHESWEGFWHALGRTTSEARFVQGLIRLAAACVKIREGRPEGVGRHALRAKELLGELAATDRATVARASDALGLSSTSIASVLEELETYRPACWHTSRVPVVRVLAADLRLADVDGSPDPPEC